MVLPLAGRTKRIVFLMALLCPSVTLAYIAIPKGDVTLHKGSATARTQDIVIDSHAIPTARTAFFGSPGAPIDRLAPGIRTAADNAAIDELALATTALSASSVDAAIMQHGAAAVTASGGGGGTTPRRTRRNASEAAFGGHGMATVGGWGGASGVAHPRDANTDAAVTPTVKTVKVKAERPARQTTPRTSGHTSTGGTTGASAGAADNGQAPILVADAAITAVSSTPAATVGNPVLSAVSLQTTGGMPKLHTAGGPSPSPTPEPISLLLMGSGLAGAWAARRYVM